MKFSLKASFLITSMFCFFALTAQENKTIPQESTKDKILKKISVTPQVGLLHSWSDFKDDGLGGFLQNNELGLNLLLNYKLNKFISISAGGLYGKLKGSTDDVNTANAKVPPNRDLGFGIFYTTDIFEITLPRVDVNLTRLIFKDRSKFFNRFSVGLIGSHGLIYSSSEIYAKQDESLNLNYTNLASPEDKRGSSGEMVEAVTSYGMGLSYIINNRFDIGVETTIRNVWNDRLDGWESNGSANDKYSFTAIGVTYHLKSRKEVVKIDKPRPVLLAAEESQKQEKKSGETVIEEKEIAVEKEVVEEVTEVVDDVVEEFEEKVPAKKDEMKENIIEEVKEVPVNTLKVVDFKDDVINFELNSSKTSEAINKQVKSIAEKLKKSPVTKITLAGYTDKSGSAAFNKTLSIQRAKWVKDQLVRKYGISNDRITVVGYGEKGTDKEFDPNNRKVEVIEVK